MINPDHQAFPAIAPNDEGWDGMTMREHFASLAMQGLVTKFSSSEIVAKTAVRMADALIAELNKPTTSN